MLEALIWLLDARDQEWRAHGFTARYSRLQWHAEDMCNRYTASL